MSKLYDLFQAHPIISTDTRRITPGSLFFALRGTSFDGNRFAADALAKGAVAAVVDDPTVATDERYVVVEDVLTALQELAREHRRTLQIPILAIAGSNGKTTTKELVSRVLAQKYHIYATRGNLNNHIGVPLTLLAMTTETEFGIVEMGASACEEIARLCEIAEPDFGLLTNVGRAHLEGFGGVEGVRRGKGELYDYLASTGGTAFVRQDDAMLKAMAEERPTLTVIHYAAQLAEGIEHHLEGDFNRYNVAAAVAVGAYFSIPLTAIGHAIASYQPDNNRSQRMQTERNTLIVDCYNANPTSMQASIRNFLNEPLGAHKRRILILGDMRELGAWAEEEHRAILDEVTDTAAEVWLVGEEFTRAATTARTPMVCFDRCDALCQWLHDTPPTEALILIKGSHSIGLERTIPLL
ncbi:MAG: UDP-N-acetylmuramoyl-tripeptide--D-alanyl-D-alanine ligase [Alistipes sp.]|nr:UDP-N-acetylmuramoyl-tripeptide--D-alanyl-D-alanine ligase [Alistipes sp.]